MIAWITGAGKGIGRAIALRLASAGYTVMTSGRDPGPLRMVADHIVASGGQAAPVLCDVTDESSVQAAHAFIAESHGPVDVLVNNAGATVFKSVLATTIEDFDLVTSANLRGPFLCTRAVLPSMLERKHGAIVMINSMAALQVFRDSSVYAATKAGLKALTDCLRLETRSEAVRVIGVYPGATDTDIWPEAIRKKYSAAMMTPADVAEQVHHALSMPSHMLVEDIVVQPIGGPL